jgi:hypothetical protein
MKKKNIFKLLAACLVIPATMSAQTVNSWDVIGGAAKASTPDDCVVGNNLYVKNGAINLDIPGDATPRTIMANSLNRSFNLLSGSNGTDGGWIGLHARNDGTEAGNVHIHSVLGGNLSVFNYSGSFNRQMMLDNVGFYIDHAQLFVRSGVIDLTNPAGDYPRAISANSVHSSLNLVSGHGNTDGANIGLHAILDPGQEGNMNFHTIYDPSIASTHGRFNFFQYRGGVFVPEMELDNDGLFLERGQLFVRSGIVDLTNPVTDVSRKIVANSVSSSLELFSGHNGLDGAWIGLNAASVPIAGQGGTMNFHTVGQGSSFKFFHLNGPAFDELVKIQADGKVIIGGEIMNNAPSNHYKLYVEKGILTERVHVASHTTIAWADFVFNNDYNLRPLAEVEDYVKKNKHLPEIPSAKEVADNGIDLAEMDAKLLQKVEELTLYMIQQQKRIEELEKQVKK